MPWKEESVDSQKARFIAAVQREEECFAQICRDFGISRKTGYKWVARFSERGLRGLEDMGRTPRTCPHAVSDEVVRQVLALRAQHPRWGPKKLRVLLRMDQPPAASTIGEILKRHGLCARRRRIRRIEPYTHPFERVKGPNASWAMDYKGQWRLQDGTTCYPFTLSDNFSRKVIRCQAMPAISGDACRLVLESAFREFGLPNAIRSDNGAPFSGRAVGGLTRLSVWLIRLGVRPERIQPGHPEQNGRHERVHLTMVQEGVVKPAAENLDEQQKRHERWKREFNSLRPHEALGMKTPDDIYRPSSRAMPLRVPDPEYPPGFQAHRVEGAGNIRLAGLRLQVGMPLVDELIGVQQLDDRRFGIWFNFVELGIVDVSTAEKGYLRVGGYANSRWTFRRPMDADAAMDAAAP